MVISTANILGGIMPTKRGKTYDVEFFIFWNDARRTFDIERDGKPTGSFAKDKKGAIGLATRSAQFETRDGKTAAVYTTNSEGKLVVEWSP